MVLGKQYQELHQLAFDRLSFQLKKRISPKVVSKFRFQRLDGNTIRRLSAKPPFSNKWEWGVACQNFTRKYRARFEMAIYYDEVLWGAVLGKLSDNKVVLRLNFIEKDLQYDKVPEEIKFVPLVSLAARIFAVLEGNVEHIAIHEPLNDGLATYYRSLGYVMPDITNPRNNALFHKDMVR